MDILSAKCISVPTQLAVQPAGDWHAAMRHAIRDVDEFCRLLQLPPEVAAAAGRGQGHFPLFVPREYMDRMEVGNDSDPLVRQILPVADELQEVPGFVTDPVGDRDSLTQPGILRKYPGRALLIVTGACAVHCRYCFRRHFPYANRPQGLQQWRQALTELAADPQLEEVLLSGGDPLTQTDDWLGELVQMLDEIPQIRRIRVHTRLPVMIPRRVNSELLEWLRNDSRSEKATRLVVIHVNHPNELQGAEIKLALAQLVEAGVPLLNQTVLLKGVNDRLDVLTELSRQLINHRVMPYYLHQLDAVAGAAHFHVPVARGRQLVRALRQQLPGYAVPRYVVECPGELSKTTIE